VSSHNDYQQLRKLWYQKLKESGFVDIEDTKGNLKDTWTRGLGFKNQRKICEFFLKLDHYLNQNEIPLSHKQILSLYSQGIYITEIQKRLKLEKRYQVKKILKQYKTIILQTIEDEYVLET
jgi:hypothetical protein